MVDVTTDLAAYPYPLPRGLTQDAPAPSTERITAQELADAIGQNLPSGMAERLLAVAFAKVESIRAFGPGGNQE